MATGSVKDAEPREFWWVTWRYERGQKDFHWTIFAKDSDEAIEVLRRSLAHQGAAKSDFRAGVVALLEADRPPAVHGEQPGRDAVANAVEVRSHTTAVDESGSARILRLAQRFREFVVQV